MTLFLVFYIFYNYIKIVSSETWWDGFGKAVHIGCVMEIRFTLEESENEIRSVVSDSMTPMISSLPSSSVHGILQARWLEWVAIPFSWGSFQPWAHNQVSHIAGGFFTVWATREEEGAFGWDF